MQKENAERINIRKNSCMNVKVVSLKKGISTIHVKAEENMEIITTQ